MKTFARFAWGVLAFNVAVIVWGAAVRATGSGAGCGGSWPLCNGQVVPRAPVVETVIEFAHRATSGIAAALVVALVVLAVRTYPRGHAARLSAWTALALMLLEAALGAGLVLFGWVAQDRSPERGWVVAIHLTNTFLLLGALASAVATARRPAGPAFRARGGLAVLFTLGLVATLVTGATGAIAALGDTLFPSLSFAAGLREEVSTGAHFLLRLRVLHPFAAVAAGIVLLLCARAAMRARPEEPVRRRAVAVAALVGFEILVGAANVGLLAPVPLQLLHLLVADLVWISLVLLAIEALAPGAGEALEAAPPITPAAQHG